MDLSMVDIDEDLYRLLIMEYENSGVKPVNRSPPILKSSNGVEGLVFLYRIKCGTAEKNLAVLVLESRVPVEELEKWVSEEVVPYIEQVLLYKKVDEVRMLYCDEPNRGLDDPPPPIIEILVDDPQGERLGFPRRYVNALNSPPEEPKSESLSKEISTLDPTVNVEKSQLEMKKSSPSPSSRNPPSRVAKRTTPKNSSISFEKVTKRSTTYDQNLLSEAESLKIKELEAKVEKLEYLVEMLMRALMSRPSPSIDVLNSVLHYVHTLTGDQASPLPREEKRFLNEIGEGKPPSQNSFKYYSLPEIPRKEAYEEEHLESTLEPTEQSSNAGETGGGPDEFIGEFLVENPWAEILSSKKRKVDKR